MTALAHEHPRQIYEMMARLGIDPAAGILPRLSLRFATASQICEGCQSKKACQDWLDYAPAEVNFAPWFCMNADILFELQYDQPGPGRANYLDSEHQDAHFCCSAAESPNAEKRTRWWTVAL